MLSKGEHAFDVDLVLSGGAELHLRKSELLSHLDALPFVCLPVNRAFVKKRLIDSFESLSLLSNV